MEKSSFFNSVSHDRRYKAEDWAEFFKSFIGNGVFVNPAAGLQVVADGSMTVKISTGKAWINGYFYHNTSDLEISIGTADGVLNRYDRIVVRWDLQQRNIKAYKVSSQLASSPSPVMYQRTPDIWELVLADIFVGAGVTSITQSNVTDQRHKSDLCGIVTGFIQQPDFTNLFSQFESAFKEWFEDIQSALGEDTAGQLLNMINNQKVRIDAGAPAVFTHTKNGTVHTFSGSNILSNGIINGTVKIAAPFNSGDTFLINGVTVPAYTGLDLTEELYEGRWMSFTFDGTQINFKSGGGAGNNFDVRVVANYGMLPVAANKNLMHIISDIPLPSSGQQKYEIGLGLPPAPQPTGKVLIQTGQDISYAFNALKGNNISYVYPVSAYQWNGTTWVMKNAYIDRGISWTQFSFVSYVLYDNGVENVPWSVFSHWSKAATYLSLSMGGSTFGAANTTSPIDVTNWNYLYVEWEGPGGSSTTERRFGLADASGDSASPLAAFRYSGVEASFARRTTKIDIRTAIGLLYIKSRPASGSTSTTTTERIYKVWLSME